MAPSPQQVTKDELLALTEATVKTTKVLEEIHFQLEKLNKLDTIDEHVRFTIASEVAEKISNMGIDFSTEQSAIAKRFLDVLNYLKVQGENIDQLKETLRRAIWAVLLLVTFFGGYRAISDFFLEKRNHRLEYNIGKNGQIYIVDPITKEEFYLTPKN